MKLSGTFFDTANWNWKDDWDLRFHRAVGTLKRPEAIICPVCRDQQPLNATQHRQVPHWQQMAWWHSIQSFQTRDRELGRQSLRSSAALKVRVFWSTQISQIHPEIRRDSGNMNSENVWSAISVEAGNVWIWCAWRSIDSDKCLKPCLVSFVIPQPQDTTLTARSPSLILPKIMFMMRNLMMMMMMMDLQIMMRRIFLVVVGNGVEGRNWSVYLHDVRDEIHDWGLRSLEGGWAQCAFFPADLQAPEQVRELQLGAIGADKHSVNMSTHHNQFAISIVCVFFWRQIQTCELGSIMSWNTEAFSFQQNRWKWLKAACPVQHYFFWKYQHVWERAMTRYDIIHGAWLYFGLWVAQFASFSLRSAGCLVYNRIPASERQFPSSTRLFFSQLPKALHELNWT